MPTDDDILTQRMLGTGKNYEPVPELPTEDEEALEATTKIPEEAGVFLAWPMRELTKGAASGLEREFYEDAGLIADELESSQWNILDNMADLESERA